MPRPRTYQHKVCCPHCGGFRLQRYGYSRCRQVYRCPECDRRCAPDASYHRPGPEVRQQAVKLRLAGLGVRAIGQLLGVNQSTVSRWTSYWKW